MQQPPVPEPRDLLPPLLACLPTTFIATRPPPALLPQLAPILRQRLAYLGNNTTVGDGWAPLLCWDTRQAAKLPEVIERLDLEPHPVSGEVEIEDVRVIQYRRLDNETLHACLHVEQFNLLPTYVWCDNDEHGETGPGWKLTELKALEDVDSAWFETIAAANAAFTSTTAQPATHQKAVSVQDDEDDGYWAAYDQAPSETPVQKQSPAPRVALGGSQGQQEEDYYARYGTEVQPALDSHDPDELQDIGESTLAGSQQRTRPLGLELTTATPPVDDDTRPAWEKALYPHAPKARTAHDSAVANSLAHSFHSELNMPRPISPASSTRSIERLEEQAAAMSDDSAESSRVSLGVKQHISTDIKSLFRLAKTAGMSRADFEGLVKRELDVLSLLDDE